jgi:hypothetical protein
MGNHHRLEKLEWEIRPRSAAAPFRVVVIHPGEPEPRLREAERPSVLLIRIVPAGREVMAMKPGPAIEPEPVDEALPAAIADLERALAERRSRRRA